MLQLQVQTTLDSKALQNRSIQDALLIDVLPMQPLDCHQLKSLDLIHTEHQMNAARCKCASKAVLGREGQREGEGYTKTRCKYQQTNHNCNGA